jgi:hypothetical protein
LGWGGSQLDDDDEDDFGSAGNPFQDHHGASTKGADGHVELPRFGGDQDDLAG